VILVENGKVVRRVKGKTEAILGIPKITVKYLSDWNCDELLFINLSGDFEGTKNLLMTATEECFIPIGIGGNIDSAEKARWCINNGAEKVVLGRNACEKLCRQIGDVCGMQAVSVSVDSDHERAKDMQRYCGEIILHDRTRDGTRMGLNLELAKIELNVPKVLMGGCRDAKDLTEGLKVADGVCAGNMFQFSELSSKLAKNEARKAGLTIR